MFGLNPKRKILEKKQKLLSEKMTHKVITCFFCFEQFEVSLEIGTSFTGNIIEIYDCEICCNPNKLDYEVYDGEININNVGDGNE